MWLRPVVLGVLGLVLVISGYQLRYKKRYGLIAGYDSRTTRNPEPIARMLGGVMLTGGVCIALLAAGLVLAPSITERFARMATVVAAVGLVAAVVIGSVILKRR